ncbi:MAG: hypothetical protein R2818_14300 [Flavobacteriales bacterium]
MGRPESERGQLGTAEGHSQGDGLSFIAGRELKNEKDDERIGLLGVQNWGHRFQQYGDLSKTIQGSEQLRYRILMSHDPTHWEHQVQGTGIDLTLSGHTHGAQFGVKVNGVTYSPAQWVYKHWAGSYEVRASNTRT